MTSRVENILAGSQFMDLNMGEGTLQKIRNVILLSFDGDEMLTVHIVDSIPPDGDDIIRPR